jgi:hypothetical protein
MRQAEPGEWQETDASTESLLVDRPRRRPDADPVVIPLGGARAVEVHSHGERTTLRVQGERHQQLDIEIRFDLAGPVVTVHATKLEIKGAQDVSTSCETFSVNASRRIELRSGGDIVQSAAGNARIEARRVDVEATPGAIRLKANDEVQALGEMILLNCEHPSTEPPMPGWVTSATRVVTPPSPAEATSGDAGVIAELLGR